MFLKSAKEALVTTYKKELDNFLEKFKKSTFEEKTRTVLKLFDTPNNSIAKLKYIPHLSKLRMEVFEHFVTAQNLNVEKLFEEFLISLIEKLKNLADNSITTPNYLEFVKYLIEETAILIPESPIS